MPATMTNPDFLTPAQVAKLLGQNVDSVRRSIRRGRITARKLGGRIYIHPDAITPPVETPAPDAPEA